eukprot:gene9657-6506_t
MSAPMMEPEIPVWECVSGMRNCQLLPLGMLWGRKNCQRVKRSVKQKALRAAVTAE